MYQMPPSQLGSLGPGYARGTPYGNNNTYQQYPQGGNTMSSGMNPEEERRRRMLAQQAGQQAGFGMAMPGHLFAGQKVPSSSYQPPQTQPPIQPPQPMLPPWAHNGVETQGPEFWQRRQLWDSMQKLKSGNVPWWHPSRKRGGIVPYGGAAPIYLPSSIPRQRMI